MKESCGKVELEQEGVEKKSPSLSSLSMNSSEKKVIAETQQGESRCTSCLSRRDGTMIISSITMREWTLICGDNGVGISRLVYIEPDRWQICISL